MVPPRISKLSKVVHILTYKGRRSPSQSSLLCGGTCPGSHANLFLARATGDNASELVLAASTVEDHQVRALIREEHAARDFGGKG